MTEAAASLPWLSSREAVTRAGRHLGCTPEAAELQIKEKADRIAARGVIDGWWVPVPAPWSETTAAQSCPFAGLFSRLRGYSLDKAREFERSAMLPYRIGVFGWESTSHSFLGFLPRCPLFLVSGWGGDRRYKFRAR